MESPIKSNKSKKNSSKKKKKETQKSQEASKERVPAINSDVSASPVETTPAKTSESNTSERLTPNQSEECRMLEWLYQNRMRDSGQCVAWGSPQGSPTLRSGKRGSIGDPWSPTSESHSVQRKPPRRLINTSGGDLPDFLSELTALSERVRAHEEELSKKSSTREHSPAEESSKPDAEDDITILENDGLTDTQTIKDGCELSSLPKLELVNQIANESFSALFDDDDGLLNECMLKCSQEVEEKLQSEFGYGDVNKLSRLSSPHQVAALSPRRRLPEKNNFIARRTSPRNSSQTFQNMKGIIKQSCETPKKKVPKVENKFCVQAICRSPMYCVNGRLLGSPRNQKSLQKNVVDNEIVSISTSTGNSEIADDSFEAVLQSFMDEDVELLSQAFSEETANKAVTSVVQPPHQSNSKRPSPARVKKLSSHHNAMPIHRLNSEDLKTNNISLQFNGSCVTGSYPSLGPIQNRQVYNLTTISKSKTVISADSNIANESGKLCLQEESSESGSISSSPPLQCTPEEIAKKKREAKLKLAKKKMTVSVAADKPVINQWNKQPVKPLITKRMK
ncbi:uncharacterized protein [Anabrus simplex]|uniref:uncharacterized protein n=1 Tax=Anabrus simplex TaxID=316456 RepID=UPI0035A29BBF